MECGKIITKRFRITFLDRMVFYLKTIHLENLGLLLSRTGQVSVRVNNNPKFSGTTVFLRIQKLKQQNTSDSSSSLFEVTWKRLRSTSNSFERNHNSGDRRVNCMISV